VAVVDVSRAEVWAVKRDKHDKVMSDLIRCRADWKCERCNCEYPPGRRGGLECSHFYGRSKQSTRHYPDNLSSFCTGCHMHLGKVARDKYEMFIRMELGPDRFDALVQRANTVYKITKAEKEERYQHYRAQFKYMERRRKEGAIGWLDFVAWD